MWHEVVTLASTSPPKGSASGKAAQLGFASTSDTMYLSMPVSSSTASSNAQIALSALDSSVARQIEGDFRAAGFAVISNASSYREDPDVPLVIPEVNPEHLAMVEKQGPGFIVTNPNCSSIPPTPTPSPTNVPSRGPDSKIEDIIQHAIQMDGASSEEDDAALGMAEFESMLREIQAARTDLADMSDEQRKARAERIGWRNKLCNDFFRT